MRRSISHWLAPFASSVAIVIRKCAFKKRQVLAMYLEEQPRPAAVFSCAQSRCQWSGRDERFAQGSRIAANSKPLHCSNRAPHRR
jgi:hypothetical protein